ncbi:MAG: response regulator [Candidatus Eisenbacteria bacterium]|uniref:histidine kinase n=1 Tax=Eiseniibacteriota bacterium TaxID=2212470 RepID=A0A948RYZ1_UNCEI|nr:response regulator [Candidatus Eisenbacteria bacterium]MBU1948220.1 response regulator [Candidatus Eisenbacteria bacterium]MBU2692159.1 response regulator [Candidatus Eisenbacteria bacterium]
MEKEATRVLVVDDEVELLDVLKDFFQMTSHELVLSSTGEEAIVQLGEQSFDVVLTDINLPGVDGLEVLRVAKEMDPDVPVILITGNASVFNAVEALRKGAFDYITKPFDLFDLEKVIDRALERRRLAEENRRLLENLKRANMELQRHEENLRDKVALATEQIKTLYEIGKEITSSLDLDRTLEKIVEKSIQLTRSSSGLLLLAEERGKAYQCQWARGPVIPDHESLEQLEWRRGLTGLAISQGQPVIENDLSLAMEGEPLHVLGATSALIVPLIQDGSVQGLIVVLDKSQDPFLPSDEEVLTLFASQAAIAIHNARIYEKIMELDRLKSDFVAVVSHELRTPLTSIKGSLEILGDERYFDIPPQQSELLQISQTNVERLESLINDILDFSKLESSRLSNNFLLADLGMVLRNATDSLETMVLNRGLKMEIQIADSIPKLNIDEMRVVQVVNNLVSNAVKFSDDGGVITIRAEMAENGAVISIIDQGVGISEENQTKLFRKFGQLDSSSTRKAGGTGLGLIISKGIVEEHGGRIWVESEPGKGSKFSFWLPLPGAAIQASQKPEPTDERDASDPGEEAASSAA